ncbi:alpha/beta hydrolase [Sphingopyxis sp. KK2]|uniref:alpha/beta hydrolase n=1 Tax=Sphingopyxis sp. KK2 TaxID=1855727 RepID=UPI00097E7305|nr:alpha/beta fold hydrolase [Sphingopyxis sp. KK2]
MIRFRRWFGLLSLAGSLSLLGGAWAVGTLQSRPANTAIASPPPPGRDVALRATDGLPVAASYWPAADTSAPAVLLLHGNDSSRASQFELAAWLAARGYAVLAIDFRGHGESAAVARSFGYFEARDAAAALAWLRAERPGASVAIIGSSLGGAASLIGEQGPLASDALILQGVYPDIRAAIRNRIGHRLGDWPATVLEPLLSYQSDLRIGVGPDRLSPISAIGRYSGPILIIGGADDHYTPPDETRRLFAAAQGPKRLWIVPGRGHNDLLATQDRAWQDHVLSFLEENLAPAR